MEAIPARRKGWPRYIYMPILFKKMNINYYLIGTYIATIILFLGTPGPVTLLIISSSIKHGFKAGLSAIIGTNLASLTLITVSFFIIKGVMSVSENSLTWLTLLGCVYLIYFSIGILRDRVDINTKSKLITKNKNHFLNGFVVGISNPKDILFFVAFLPNFFVVSNNIYYSIIVLTVIWVILDYSILILYANIFSKVMNNKIANTISMSSGVLLLALALYGLYRTIVLLFFY